MVKRNPYIIEEVIREYESGNSPTNLAEKWGVHPTTIRRWIKRAGKTRQVFSTPNNIDEEAKMTLRKILLKYNIENIDEIIMDITSEFYIEIKEDKQDEDFPLIILD